MKSILTIAVLIVSAGPAWADVVSAPHVELKYEGIDADYAKALADTIGTARQVYVDHFGFDMPETVRADVTCAPRSPARLFTDGKDGIFLTIPSQKKLTRPSKSGVFNIYGMCHELGHMAMYRTLKDRDWMTSAAAEGWAHYAGSVVVDHVYKIKGRKLWPDQYDYRQDGSSRLKKQLEAKRPSKTAEGAGKWQELEVILGRKGFAGLFVAWQNAKIDPTDPSKALLQVAIEMLGGKSQPQTMPAEVINQDDRSTVTVRTRKTTDMPRGYRKKSEALKEWWRSASKLFVEPVQTSEFTPVRVSASALIGRPIKLAFDDGSSEGRKSIAGGGHARKFAAPGAGDWYIRTVYLYGARYGHPRAPSTSFDIALCDEQMREIVTWKRPYRTFKRGDMKWVRMGVPTTRVPENFYVCLNFRPERSKGVFVGYDTSTTGNSLVATPGKPGSPFEQGDWMIRIELDQLKDADALQDDTSE
ncbi:MAG: hypothetical protein JSV03_01220 [Planctomycetota bacterium]|nr:MAG: hypothetical protein JSV03_01220 [Planctomycetota bacterium]